MRSLTADGVNPFIRRRTKAASNSLPLILDERADPIPAAVPNTCRRVKSPTTLPVVYRYSYRSATHEQSPK